MTLTDELKIIDDRIKANQAQYDLSREAAKISALSSKDLLERYENFTGKDLGRRPSVLEKTYSPLESDFNYDSILHRLCHLLNHFKKMSLRILRKDTVILIMIAIINFTNFTKGMMNLKRCH